MFFTIWKVRLNIMEKNIYHEISFPMWYLTIRTDLRHNHILCLLWQNTINYVGLRNKKLSTSQGIRNFGKGLLYALALVHINVIHSFNAVLIVCSWRILDDEDILIILQSGVAVSCGNGGNNNTGEHWCNFVTTLF